MKKYIVYGFLVLSMILPSVSIAEVAGDYDPSPNASTCFSIKSDLRYQSRDANTNGEVSTLQDFLQSKGYLNTEPTGYFGLLTLEAVKAFQNSYGISPSGYVGSLTRAKIAALGCDGKSDITPKDVSTCSSSGYDTRTGLICGCATTSGFSTTTGKSCEVSKKYPPGCTSAKGFSSTTGEYCDGSKPPTGIYPDGCTSAKGYSYTTGWPCDRSDYAEPKVEVKTNNGEKVVNINKGETVYVHWTSQNTFSCNAVGSAWDRTGLSDTLVTSGYIGVTPQVSAEYTISCKGNNKTVSDSLKVNVNSVSTCSAGGYDTRTGLPCGCSSGSGYSTVDGRYCGLTKTPSPFLDSNYSETSPTPLSSSEKIVKHTYQTGCGTLMSSYASPGSVSVGNGPVYASAVSACGANSTPDTSTFRTYSCSNSSNNGSVVGNATFAFQCKVPTVKLAPGCSSTSGYSSTTGEPCN